MAKVIIFGLNDFAELAHYYLMNDSDHEVVAFCVNKEFLPEDNSFKGLPIVDFETVEEKYPPGKFMFFTPMSPTKMNQNRQWVYSNAKNKGYDFISYISSRATVLTDKIGENCFILENNTIQPFVEIGNDVILWSGNHIGHHSVIEDHVMFTSHVVLSGHCHVKKFAILGVNSTVRDGVIIEEGTFVGMSSSVVKNTEPWMIYIGNPAKPFKSSK